MNDINTGMRLLPYFNRGQHIAIECDELPVVFFGKRQLFPIRFPSIHSSRATPTENGSRETIDTEFESADDLRECPRFSQNSASSLHALMAGAVSQRLP